MSWRGDLREIDPSMEIAHDDAREGDAEHTHADVTKAEAFPDYEPSVSIREGAWLFVEWYREER
jgi:UDP-glucose 4-epimerase